MALFLLYFFNRKWLSKKNWEKKLGHLKIFYIFSRFRAQPLKMKIGEEKLKLRFEIVRLFEDGYSQREIAERTSVPRSTVQYILRNYSKYDTVMRIKGSGRRKSLNDEDKTVLRGAVKENPMNSSRKLAVFLAGETGKKVTYRTVQSELKAQGLLSAVPKKIPLLSKKILLTGSIKQCPGRAGH
jgi:transposase